MVGYSLFVGSSVVGEGLFAVVIRVSVCKVVVSCSVFGTLALKVEGALIYIISSTYPYILFVAPCSIR